MVEATEVRYRLDPALPQNWPCQWRIFVQRQVRAGSIVVVGIGAKYAAQMGLAENDQMVQALSSDRSDQPFNVGVLPGRTGCRGTISGPVGPEFSSQLIMLKESFRKVIICP
jgi:hypothetical protein